MRWARQADREGRGSRCAVATVRLADVHVQRALHAGTACTGAHHVALVVGPPLLLQRRLGGSHLRPEAVSLRQESLCLAHALSLRIQRPLQLADVCLPPSLCGGGCLGLPPCRRCQRSSGVGQLTLQALCPCRLLLERVAQEGADVPKLGALGGQLPVERGALRAKGCLGGGQPAAPWRPCGVGSGQLPEQQVFCNSSCYSSRMAARSAPYEEPT